MAGVYLPLQAMEHQYLISDDIPEVYERDTELPHVMDPGGESYFRQEGRGLVIGIYEQHCDPWSVDSTPWDFGLELLPDNLDRIADSLEMAYHRYPCLETAGIKKVINGPFTFAPDGNPLVGPVPGLRNYWSACAVMAGFSQGGGVGLTLAEWMVEGEPSRDVFAMDVARFGDYCTKPYTVAKVRENYQHRFAITYPNEELPAGRPHHTTPAYAIWDKQRAVFGFAYGMEHVNYFAREGEERLETPSFRRSNAFERVGEECRAVRTAVGINEIHNFGKYEVTGPAAAAWLDHVMAGRLPREGRISLTPMLAESGRLVGDFTVMRLGPEHFQLTASFGAQAYHMRWFEDHMAAAGVTLRNISLARIGFQIAGPRARDLLARVTDADVSNEAFPFLSVRRMKVGGIDLLARVTDADVSNEAFPFLSVRRMKVGGIDAIVARVSFTGDLGYEIYVAADKQVALYEALAPAGAELGLRPFGMRAMMSLRLEKNFGSWMREYKPDYTPAETGMDRFVNHKKDSFIGREAYLAQMNNPPDRRLCHFIVDAADADVVAWEPIWKDGDVVGYVTSGGYAHYSEKSVAFGFVPIEMIEEGAEFEIEILGDLRKATLFTEPLFDPKAERMRG
jgi:dimethylglycine dehydrogenase